MTESTDLKHAKRRLIGSKNAGEKMIGLEQEYRAWVVMQRTGVDECFQVLLSDAEGYTFGLMI